MMLPYFFAAQGDVCRVPKGFLGIIPVWYKYLPYKRDVFNKCTVVLDDLQGNPEQLLLIGIAVIEMLLRLIGILAFVFLLYGGFQYITSQGEPDNTKKALETIRNAIIGAVIATIASQLVRFLGESLA